MNDVGLLMSAAENAKSALDTIQKRRDDIAYQDYSKIIRERPDDFTPPEKANYKIWNKAVVDHIGVQLQQGELQNQRMALLKNNMAMGREAIIANAQKAESLVATNAHAALASYMDSYSKHPNGVSVKYNDESKLWDFEDAVTGEKWSTNVTIDDARQMTQAMLSPGKYEEVYLSDRSRISNFNKIAASNPDLLEDKNGERVAMFTFIDPNNGSKAIRYINTRNEIIDLSPEDLLQRGFKTTENNYEERVQALNLLGKETDIENTRSQIAARQQGMSLAAQSAARGESGGGAGPGLAVDKDVAGVMDAYGVSKAKAMDILRADKKFGDLLRAANAEIEEQLLDPDDPEDAEKVQAIRAKYGVDKVPGKEGYGEKTEVREEKKEEAAPREESPKDVPILEALAKQFPKAPDGAVKYLRDQAFVKTGGKWRRKVKRTI